MQIDTTKRLNRSVTRRDRLSAVLSSGDIVTVDGAQAALGVDRRTAAKTLARWTRQGWLARVRRGTYAPVPLGSSQAVVAVEDAWMLVPELFGLGYVGGASAAHHWDLTEQLFRTVFVYTTQVVRRTKQTIHGTRFSVHHIDRRLLFGTRPLWRGSVRIDVSDVHRTIIDMLNDPGAGGGARHISECIAAYFRRKDADPKRLIEYADRLGNGAVFKRLGFLGERSDAPAAVMDACLRRLTKGYAKLDPALAAPHVVRRWHLRIPASWKDARRDDSRH
ncbi:MAG: type IV toxin-antitoxin system AbiEi family antitoxin domain-containing protein [Vicinamibacterales bacterium]